jgi:hypothetical protein
MKINYRPAGWRNESYRHYLAAKGVKTRFYSPKYEVTIPDGFTADEQKRVQMKIKNLIDRHKDEAFNRRLHEKREPFTDVRRMLSERGGVGYPVREASKEFIFTPVRMSVEVARAKKEKYDEEFKEHLKSKYMPAPDIKEWNDAMHDMAVGERRDKDDVARGRWAFHVSREGDAFGGNVTLTVEGHPDYYSAQHAIMEMSYNPRMQQEWDERLDANNQYYLDYWKSLVEKGEGNEYTPQHIAKLEEHMALMKKDEALAMKDPSGDTRDERLRRVLDG